MIALVAVALAQEASLLELPIDVERFKPPSDTFGYVVTESSTTLGHLQVGTGMWGHYESDSLVLLRNGQRVIGPPPDFPDAILEERSLVHFQAGLGLGDVFGLSVDLPVYIWQEGFEPTELGTEPEVVDLQASGLGDLRVSPKLVLLDIHQGTPIGIALVAPVSFPTASTRSFMGEGELTASPVMAVELADGSVRDRDYHVRFAINAGARVKGTDTFRGLKLGPEFLYRAGLAAHPAPAVELGVDLNGSLAGPLVPQAPLEILPFLRLLPVDTASLVVGGGFGLIEGVGSPDLRLFAGATLAPKFDPLSLDRDKDGIPNKYDKCISIPEDLDGFQDEDGCPDEDNDQDGLLDTVDRCPNDPEDLDRFQDEDGCPDPDNDGDGIFDVSDRCPFDPEDFDGFQDLDGCPEPDNDGDGFLDPADACPNAAETINGFEDTDGCPDEMPHVDTDGDGIQDKDDRCPFDPEDYDGFQDEDGCPDPDNDLDGIFDVQDACPFDPETKNGYKDEDGCPDEAPSRVIVKKSKIEILEKVFFEFDKAIIQSVSYSLLDEVATVIIEHPNLTLIRVEGHTDADGSETYNEHLSQRRAEAVVDYLIGRGVEGARLDPVGFGESRPIDTNKTQEGKANNRRVEFVIVEQE
ncbi:MAG: OmpA family protein [Alphaproteobacteria bacterium]|nr:OmpA family protein [Alphaproteobacteria bacterium]